MYTSNALAGLIYVAYLFVPGYLALRVSRVKEHVFLLSFGISFTVLVVSRILFGAVSGPILVWYFCFFGVVSVSLLVSTFVRAKKGSIIVNPDQNAIRGGVSGCAFVLAGFGVYHIIVGPYTEVPSDFWAHLAEVTTVFDEIHAGEKLSYANITGNSFVPFLHANVANLVGVRPIEIVGVATLITSATYLGSVFWFSVWSSMKLGWSSNQTLIVGVLAAVLALIALGVSTFSYVRYYAYFPHILNSSLLLVVIVLFVDYLEGRTNNVLSVVAVAGFIGVMLVTNRQEALFALIVVGGISILKFVKQERFKGASVHGINKRVLVAGTGSLILGIGSVILISMIFPAGVMGWPHVISLKDVHASFPNWLIANPKMRFWDTVGLFGVVVYVWYFVRIKTFRDLDYVTVGMFIPVLTLFNPWFVSVFLKIASWDSLWRFAYLIPIPLVAALLITDSWRSVVRTPKFGNCVKQASLSVFAVIMILPVDIDLIHDSKSRIYSLASVDKSNGALLWGDLIQMLGSLPEPRHLITDSVTNYVLTSSTQHSGKYDGKKGGGDKESWQQRRNFFQGDYQGRLLGGKFANSLVIINNRNGAESRNGKISGHWWADILEVSSDYPSGALEFLQDNPQSFRLIWEGENIWVFEITPGVSN